MRSTCSDHATVAKYRNASQLNIKLTLARPPPSALQCGMAVFPGEVGLLILFANYLMEVKRDGPAARTQLQLALKAGPRWGWERGWGGGMLK